jgi:hypothetical protein
VDLNRIAASSVIMHEQTKCGRQIALRAIDVDFPNHGRQGSALIVRNVFQSKPERL